MNKKEKIKKYRESVQVEANEEKIQETIYKSKIRTISGLDSKSPLANC